MLIETQWTQSKRTAVAVFIFLFNTQHAFSGWTVFAGSDEVCVRQTEHTFKMRRIILHFHNLKYRLQIWPRVCWCGIIVCTCGYHRDCQDMTCQELLPASPLGQITSRSHFRRKKKFHSLTSELYLKVPRPFIEI